MFIQVCYRGHWQQPFEFAIDDGYDIIHSGASDGSENTDTAWPYNSTSLPSKISSWLHKLYTTIAKPRHSRSVTIPIADVVVNTTITGTHSGYGQFPFSSCGYRYLSNNKINHRLDAL